MKNTKKLLFLKVTDFAPLFNRNLVPTFKTLKDKEKFLENLKVRFRAEFKVPPPCSVRSCVNDSVKDKITIDGEHLCSGHGTLVEGRYYRNDEFKNYIRW